ncbi:MAG: hypothetical protein JWN79_3277 [Gemmatimonadetes bacterium]|nr:hypothetical protein [Gemmatimonadota bacterium]
MNAATRCMLTLAALVAPASPLVAQGTRTSPRTSPRMVPIEVVRSVTGLLAGFVGELEFTADRAPGDWPAALLPPAPARVLGGASSAVLTTLTFDTPARPASAITQYATVLERAGWFAPPKPPVPGGFQPAPERPAASVYCHGGEYLFLRTGDTAGVGTVVNVVLNRGGDGSFSPVCDTTSHVRRIPIGLQTASGTPVDLPTLTPPAGVEQKQGSRTYASGGEVSSQLTMTTTIPADKLLAHYTAQLESLGWARTAAPLANAAMAAATLEKSEGTDRWRILLLITDQGTTRDLLLRLRSAPSR